MADALGWLVGLAGCGLLLALSAVLLARLRAGGEAPPSAGRLRGLDLLAAALLAAALAHAGFRWIVPPDAGDDLLAQVGVYAAAMAAAALYLRLRGGRGGFLRPASARRGPGWALRAWLAGLPGLFAVLWVNARLLAWISGVEPGSEALAGFDALDPGARIAVAALAVGVMPALEELLFRGHLFGHLAGRPEYGPGRALLLSGLVFAALHPPGMILPAAYLGLLFGWIRWRGGDLRLSVLAHAAHNAAALLLGLLPGSLARLS